MGVVGLEARGTSLEWAIDYKEKNGVRDEDCRQKPNQHSKRETGRSQGSRRVPSGSGRSPYPQRRNASKGVCDDQEGEGARNRESQQKDAYADEDQFAKGRAQHLGLLSTVGSVAVYWTVKQVLFGSAASTTVPAYQEICRIECGI